jgi:hypothetical protein
MRAAALGSRQATKMIKSAIGLRAGFAHSVSRGLPHFMTAAPQIKLATNVLQYWLLNNGFRYDPAVGIHPSCSRPSQQTANTISLVHILKREGAF